MHRFARWTLCAAAATTSAAATSPPTSAPADLQPWVDRLGDPDPAARQSAEHRLATAGTRAVPTLSAALDDPRPEVAARARRALRRVRLFALRTGTDLDAPLTLSDRYLSAENPATRLAIVQQLAAVAPRPIDVIVRLSLLEPDAALRTQLLATVGAAYRLAVPRLVAEGDGDALAALLHDRATGLPYAGAADYAVERQTTGHWDDAVAQWRAELANGDEPHRALAAQVLCALYRAADKPGDAADMARRSQDWRLVLATAIDRGDWPTAAATATGWPGGKGVALRAALGALANPAPGPARPVSVDADAYAADADAINLGKVRLLLGDVDGGLARLSLDPAQGGDPVAAFRLRQARGDYDDALALANRFAGDPKLGPALAPLRDALRQLLGDLPPSAEPHDPAPRQAAPRDALPPPPDPAWTSAVADLAAQRYAAAAADLAAGDGDPARVDWWFVRGHALEAAGDVEHGRSLMRAASLATLAGTSARARLGDRLSAAGLDAAAAQQRALAVRMANPFNDYGALLDLHLSRESAATADRDFPAAADAADRVWLLSFWPGPTWAGPLPFLTVPADVHLARARLARSKDDWPAALRELESYRAFLPASADVPLEWVPLLDARGDHAAADALFATACDALETQATRHPRSPYLHNQAAWLAACCCRRLDGARAHAESAVRLAPADWQFTDTLAEVRFRLGDRAAAADLERRAATFAGADAPYLARQLARFGKADVPSTTRPSDAPS